MGGKIMGGIRGGVVTGGKRMGVGIRGGVVVDGTV